LANGNWPDAWIGEFGIFRRIAYRKSLIAYQHLS